MSISIDAKANIHKLNKVGGHHAPEMDEAQPLTRAADMWSAGGVLTELFLNKDAFRQFQMYVRERIAARKEGKTIEKARNKDSFFIRPTRDQLESIPKWLSSESWE